METALTTTEQGRLAECEAVIERGLSTFVEVGEALREVHDSELYREEFTTFDVYCQSRWDIKRAHAYRLIEAATVVKTVSPMGDIRPTNERQARPLFQVPEHRQPEVWQDVIKTALKDDNGNPIVTAKHVEDIVKKHMEPDASPEPAADVEVVEKDDLGTPLTSPEMETDFARRPEMTAIQTTVQDLRKRIKAICETTFGAYVSRQECDASLKRVWADMKFAKPYVVCPYCKGRKCKNCHKVGWMPKDVYDRVPAEVKA